MNAIQICHRCQHGPHGEGRTPCNGPCPCLADPARRDIGELAANHTCPLGLFTSRGAGDTVAAVLDATGIGPLAKRVIEATTGKPCGCSGRQEALNKLMPYKGTP